MALTLQYKMAQPQSSLDSLIQFVKDSWPMIVAIVTVWKGIDAVSKHFSQKQEAKLRALIQAEVTPQIKALTQSIDDLREAIGALKMRS